MPDNTGLKCSICGNEDKWDKRSSGACITCRTAVEGVLGAVRDFLLNGGKPSDSDKAADELGELIYLIRSGSRDKPQ